MDKLSYIWVNSFICLILVSLTYCEIHRAKINSKNAGKRTDTSYVAESDSVEVNENDTLTFINKMERNTVGSVSEVWFYSIGGSMLVGLSGIFPLLVIPIEAGPSLKHGGEKLCLSPLYQPFYRVLMKYDLSYTLNFCTFSIFQTMINMSSFCIRVIHKIPKLA